MAETPQCFDPATGEEDHDWRYISDWYGDPGVINGTADCSRWECSVCGAEDNDREPPEYEYDDS